MSKTFKKFTRPYRNRVILDLPGRKLCLVFAEPTKYAKEMTAYDIGDAIFFRVIERMNEFGSLTKQQKRLVKQIMRPLIKALSDISYTNPEVLETLYSSGKRRVLTRTTTSSIEEITAAKKHKNNFRRYVLTPSQFKKRLL